MFTVRLTLDDSDGNRIEVVREAYMNLPSRDDFSRQLDEYAVDFIVDDAVKRLKAAAE